MKLFLLFSILLLTQPVWAFAPSPGGQGSDPTHFLLMILMFIAIFYFIVIRPQQREQRQHQERINNVKKGDRVVTSGGIHGEIKAVKEKTLVVEIADGVKITVNRQAVSAVLENTSSKGRAEDNSDDDEEGN